MAPNHTCPQVPCCHGTSGHVWQGRYKSFLIQQDSHLLVVIRYVERNPVRAELVDSAANWQWSSHLASIGDEHVEITGSSSVIFPSNRSKYVNQPLLKLELGFVHQSVNRQALYASAHWQSDVPIEYSFQTTLVPVVGQER